MGTSQLGFLDHPDENYWKRKPYGFYDQDHWTPGELLAIDAVMMSCIGDVGSGYNSWMFSKFSYGTEAPRFSVKRYTWETDQWWSFDLNELLHALALDSAQLVSELPEDANLITLDDLWNGGEGWGDYYREKGKGEFDDYYGKMAYIWLVERPYLRCMLWSYDTNVSLSSRMFTNVRYIAPPKRVA